MNAPLVEAPLILRREQLNAPHRGGAAGNDDEDGEADDADGNDEMDSKPKAKAKAKATAKAKAKAKAKATAKAKAKAKAKAEAKAKAKAKAKAALKRPASAGDASMDDSPEMDGAEPAPKRKKVETKDAKEVATFARRYQPTHEDGIWRFQAIKNVFIASIASQIHRQSSFQD